MLKWKAVASFPYVLARISRKGDAAPGSGSEKLMPGQQLLSESRSDSMNDDRVRHRTIRSKGCLSNKTVLAMVFKLVDAAQKSWRRLDGHNQLPKLIQGVRFTDGIEVAANPVSSSEIAAA